MAFSAGPILFLDISLHCFKCTRYFLSKTHKQTRQILCEMSLLWQETNLAKCCV